MTSQTEKAKAKLAVLSSSFDDLEAMLDPLFTQTLSESITGLEPIQQAKMQTVLPYLVYDLIFIYLKLRGIDPKTHPVVNELERVKQYFNKISAAEKPSTRRTEIDKEAAQRFIKHAITQAGHEKTVVDETPTPSSSTRVQAKITSKMLERQLYEKKLKEQDAQGDEDEDDGMLEIMDDVQDNNMDSVISDSELNTKAKGKARETLPEEEVVSRKRRRPAVDPFAGYGDDSPSLSLPENLPANLDKSGAPSTKGSGNITPIETGTLEVSDPIISSGSKKTKKAKKRNRKSLVT